MNLEMNIKGLLKPDPLKVSPDESLARAVKADSMVEFRKLNTKIRAMPNIRSTITMFIE